MRAFLHNLALAAGGYALAVFVATCVCVLPMVVSDIVTSDFDRRPDFIIETSAVFFFGLIITACTALPGFIATLAISRWQGWGSIVYYSLCGVATAILAVMLFTAYLHNLVIATGMLTNPLIYLGGLAGGFTFALYDRRFCVFV